MNINSIQFSSIPHHNISTKTDQFFSNASHAIAEFVDNSLQATNDRQERKISIHAMIDKKDNKHSYLLIADNGKGMGEREIRHFATLALDQKSREIQFEEEKSMISKFGVGAKQAGK